MEKSVFTAEYREMLRLLREVRREQGLTQAQLADRLQETQSWVSKWERAEHRLDIIELRRICAAMGISVMEFVARLEEALSSL